jgi:hypothetical protein
MNNLASGSKPVNRRTGRKVKRKDTVLKKSTITCKCGVQILLVPDVKEMNLALEAHISEHKKNATLSDLEAEAILDYLIAQVFGKIGQEN